MKPGLGTAQLKHIYERVARRYDWQHAVITARSDQRGRAFLVKNAVREGDRVLDCGAGTGTTGIMAAKKAGPDGKVVLFDLCEEMLEVARRKVARAGVTDTVEFRTGDMARLPFADGAFDVVLSTYSLCPLTEPVQGALEMYRVTRPGGRLGAAHSAVATGRFMGVLAEHIDSIAWRFPDLSMGCRPVDVLPALEQAGARVLLRRRIGIPLWPFMVFVVQKTNN